MSDATQNLKDAVVAALHTVVDPCGMFNGSRITIGELGMYRHITVCEHKLQIELFLDDPSCAFAGQIMLDIHRAVEPIAGGRQIEMNLVVDDFWDVDRISAAGQRKLDESREQQQRRVIPMKRL
jgi:metal-sulfur cluster biosynthetic enzyme